MDNTKWKVLGFVAIALAVIACGIAIFKKK